MNQLIALFLLAVITISGCTQPNNTTAKSLLIDADTANEVDDLYAIVRALLAPELIVVGLTAAQFHTSPLASDTTAQESYAMNQNIIKLLNRQDVPLALGDNRPLLSADDPVISEATELIINKAHRTKEGHTLHIAILGSCTNVASAILLDPTIIPKIAIHYIGFWHDPVTNSYNKKEFNSGNDTIAVEVLLNTIGLDFNVMTATTCQHLIFSKLENDKYLKGRGGISDYLTDRWESYERWWTKEDPEKKEWIMWDVAIIEALINPASATRQMMSTPKENTPRQIGIYTDIDVPAMTSDFWQVLDTYNQRQ